MDDLAPIHAVAALLVRLKRRIAPQGSRRERFARYIYGPLFRTSQIQQVQQGGRGEQLMAPAAEDAEAFAHEPVIVARPPTTRPTVLTGARRLPADARLLVLKLDHIGDLIVAMPALQRLRDAMPAAEITLVCGAWNRALAEGSGLVDRVAVFDALAGRDIPPDPAATQASFASLAQALAGEAAFDCAIDLRHDADTRPLLMLAPARLRAGYVAPELAGDPAGPLDIALPDVEHIAQPLAARTRLLLLVETVLDTVYPPPHPVRALATAPPGVELPPRYAVLAPGAGTPIKIWPAGRMAELGAALVARHGLALVLLGGPNEREAADQLAARLPTGTTDLTGRLAIDALPAVIAGAALVVGMDSGLTHLAANLGVPTVCVMSGIARLAVWQVSGPRVATVTSLASCSPCHFSRVAQCPHDIACLDAITADDALAACETVLGPAA